MPARPPDSQPPYTLAEWDKEIREPEPPARRCIDAGQLGLVAGQLHGACGPVVCGEVGAGAAAHVVQGGRREAKIQVQAASFVSLISRFIFFSEPENKLFSFSCLK